MQDFVGWFYTTEAWATGGDDVDTHGFPRSGCGRHGLMASKPVEQGFATTRRRRQRDGIADLVKIAQSRNATQPFVHLFVGMDTSAASWRFVHHQGSSH